MWKKLFTKLYVKGNGTRVQCLLPGIFRLSKNKEIKEGHFTKYKRHKSFQPYVRINNSIIPFRMFSVTILMSPVHPSCDKGTTTLIKTLTWMIEMLSVLSA